MVTWCFRVFFAAAISVGGWIVATGPHNPAPERCCPCCGRGSGDSGVEPTAMDYSEISRAQARRATWSGGKGSSFEEMAEMDVQFWEKASPSDKFNAVWQMGMEMWSLKGEGQPAPRLQGSIVGIRRREN